MKRLKVFFCLLMLIVLGLMAGTAMAECEHQWYYGLTRVEYELDKWDVYMHKYSYYMGNMCMLCDEIKDETRTDYDEDYHDFDENNVCTSCGYAADPNCKHENRWDAGGPGLIESSVPFTDTQHYSSDVHTIYCDDCGIFLTEEYTYYWKDHRDLKGECMCGCPDPSLPLRPLTVDFHSVVTGAPIGATEAEIGTNIGATGSVKGGSGRREYYMYGYSDTGLTVSKNINYLLFEAEAPGTWVFELTVTDTETGEVVTVRSTPVTVYGDCLHKGDTYIGNESYGLDAEKAVTDKQHPMEKYAQIYCSDCGGYIDTVTEDVWEDHQYGPDGACICGHKSSEILSIHLYAIDTEVCVGEYFAVTAGCSGGSGQYSYDWVARNVDGLTVPGVQEMQADTVGAWTFSLTLTDTVTGETAQATSDYITVSDHKSIQQQEIVKNWKACESDTGKHYAWMTHKVDVCTDCNAVVGDTTIITSYEEHESPIVEPHVFGGNFCKDCGYYDMKYSLCCPSAEYCVANNVLMSRESSVDLRIRDNHTGKLYRVTELAGMSLECKLGRNMTLSEDGRLWIKSGAVDVKLCYNGRQLDLLTVGTSWLDVPTWGEKEGVAAGTLFLRLEDLQGVAWNKTGIWLNRGNERSIGMFEFKATHSGDFYNVSFEIYNGTPITFGVVSYYPDGRECDRQLIQAYSPDWGLGHAVWQMGQVAVDTFSAKYGNSGFHTEKTDVSIRVPEGGAFCFVEASQDAEVAMQNVVELWMSIVVNSGEYLDAIFPGDAVSKKAVKKGLEDVDGWRSFRNEVAGEMLKALDVEDGTLGSLSAKDVLSLTKTGSKFALDLLQNDKICDVLLQAVKKLAISTTLSAMEKAITKIVGGTYGALAFELEEMLLDHAYMMQHLDALQAYSFGSFDLIQWEMVMMPVD